MDTNNASIENKLTLLLHDEYDDEDDGKYDDDDDYVDDAKLLSATITTKKTDGKQAKKAPTQSLLE